MDADERATSQQALARFVSELPDAEKTALLVRVAEGEGALLGAELFRRVRGGVRRGDAAKAKPRTVAALRSAAERRADERQRRAAEQAARKEARRRREQAIAREKHLKSLAKREPAAWEKVGALIATRAPSAYDEAVQLLRDLRAVVAQAGRAAEARGRIERLRDEHARKPSFVERLRRAGLIERDGR